jgi:hypothetical protein
MTGSRASVADRLAGLDIVLAAVSAGAGLLVPGLYRDTEAWVRQARAADLVTLVVVVPVLAMGLWRARAGSGAGRLITLAALGYLVYNYAIFGFAVAINAMTPVHIAILGLSVWSLVLQAIDLSRAPLGSSIEGRLPRRTTAAFLIAVPALFGLMWLGQIAQAIASGGIPDELANLGLPTNPVYALDLALALPFLAVSGVLLMGGRPVGAALGVVALAWVALMGFGVLAIFAFDAAVGVAVPVGVVGVVVVITAVGLALTALGLTPKRRGRSTIVASP